MVGVKGQKSGGRNRKATAKLKAEGGYYHYRHGDRLDANLQPNGVPKKPRGLTDYQDQLWDDVVSTLPVEMLGRIDSTMLTALVGWYREYKEGDTLHARAKAWDRFRMLAIDYGMTPSARAAIKFPVKEKEEDGFADLLDKMTGGRN